MSVQISIAERAELDLAQQYRWYTDHAGIEVAERFLQRFDQQIKQLAQRPRLGWPRRFRAPELSGIHSWSIGGDFAAFLIFYRLVGDTLSVERVMHGARDLPRRLLEPPTE